MIVLQQGLLVPAVVIRCSLIERIFIMSYNGDMISLACKGEIMSRIACEAGNMEI
ncbi:MAG: hypothetical protein IJP29_05635 [Lachnospiraceae bacterium]|nr:hypothetical protein [Lachnospiraceae bacterium]